MSNATKIKTVKTSKSAQPTKSVFVIPKNVHKELSVIFKLPKEYVSNAFNKQTVINLSKTVLTNSVFVLPKNVADLLDQVVLRKTHLEGAHNVGETKNVKMLVKYVLLEDANVPMKIVRL